MKIVQLECELEKELKRANAKQFNTFVAIPPSHSMSPEHIVTTCSSVSYRTPPTDVNPPAVLYILLCVESGAVDLLRTLTPPSGATVDLITTTPAVVT